MFPYDNKWTPMKKLVWLRGNPAGGGGGSDPLNTFTGAIVRFLAKKAKPIVKVEANFTPIQSGTGDPSPDNIRPISGHTGCDIFDKAEYDAQATPTATISFGSTVYGGTLTVNEDGSGQVVADRAIITANGTESWTKPDNCFKTESLHADSDYPQGISNTYTVGTSYSAVNGNNNRIAAHSTWFRIHDERFSTTDALKTYLSENNVQFVYELATPVTIPLTASQINTLAGENNVWVNAATGDITVQAYGTAIT